MLWEGKFNIALDIINKYTQKNGVYEGNFHIEQAYAFCSKTNTKLLKCSQNYEAILHAYLLIFSPVNNYRNIKLSTYSSSYFMHYMKTVFWHAVIFLYIKKLFHLPNLVFAYITKIVM